MKFNRDKTGPFSSASIKMGASSDTTLVVLLLDETGSMAVNKDVTVSGVNEYIDTLRGENILFSLVCFNSMETRVIRDMCPIDSAAHLSPDEYQPRAMTPLHDAIGDTIVETYRNREKGEGVIVVIQTDGQENDSIEYTGKMIKGMIKEGQDEGWEFLFLGADPTTYESALNIGIDRRHTVNYGNAAQDIANTFAVAGVASRAYATNKSKEGFTNLQKWQAGDETAEKEPD